MLATAGRGAGRPDAAYLLLVGAGAALSRAGFIALAAGLVVLCALAGVAATIRRAAPSVLGAAVAVAALAPSFPVEAAPRPLLAVAGLLGGAVIALGPLMLPGPAGAAATGAAWLLGAIAVGTRLDSGRVREILASRGNLESAGRSGAIRAALDLVAARPWAGSGLGQARFVWGTPDGNGQIALYVHDEYLQTLVDLGAIGAALLLALLAAIVVTVRPGRASEHRPDIRAGAIAALAAFAVHSGFDFLWHIAVLPLAAGLLLGLAAPSTGGKTSIITGGEGQ